MKLKDLTEQVLQEAVKSQREIAVLYNNLTTPEKTYEKRRATVSFRIADQKETITTVIDGEKETQKEAKKGDYIITGKKNEKYVLSPEQVEQNYVPYGDLLKTKPVKVEAKQWNLSKTSFTASWNETMIIERGDYLVKRPKGTSYEYYRVEQETFEKTYR